uniref:Uncharacterized protein n=1 Tax=Romanomermis culicivorax TaxID=13658 RepID=A0A915HVX0_ROMCU
MGHLRIMAMNGSRTITITDFLAVRRGRATWSLESSSLDGGSAEVVNSSSSSSWSSPEFNSSSIAATAADALADSRVVVASAFAAATDNSNVSSSSSVLPAANFITIPASRGFSAAITLICGF